jgi:UDP-glucose 4-epimerase
LHYLITGGGGFVGSHIIDNLVARGDMVTVLDNFTTGTMDNLSHHDSESSINVINGSILDVNMVREKVAEVDRVIHLAAAVGVKA